MPCVNQNLFIDSRVLIYFTYNSFMRAKRVDEPALLS